MRLVVGDASWADMVPAWVMSAIETERMIQGFSDLLRPGELPEEVGDAEIVAYLMTASMRAPMPHYYAEIYIWVASKLSKEHGKPLHDFMEEALQKGLNGDEKRELADLRRDLWRKRGGRVRTPLLDALGDLKKEAAREERAKPPQGDPGWSGTMSLFGD
jgi:hypothetical protein